MSRKRDNLRHDELDEILLDYDIVLHQFDPSTREEITLGTAKSHEHIKQQLNALINKKVAEARIDELERIVKNTVRCYDHADGRHIETPSTLITDRLKQLKDNPNE